MKKYQYIVAAACVLVGAVGFSSIYLTNQAEKREAELAKQQQLVQESQQIEVASNEKQQETDQSKEMNQIADANIEGNIDLVDDPMAEQDLANQQELIDQQLAQIESEEPQPEDVENEEVASVDEPEETDTAVENIVEEKLTFRPEKGLVWPVEGSVLLDYSMESTIFFPTLQQYQYNPAMILSSNVNDKVYFVARGKITAIETNEVTGCTVTQDLGDGYTAIYGQLKELNFDIGDIVESGQVVGYVNEPTKYYSVEGSNVYFQLLKDGVPMDPEEILP